VQGIRSPRCYHRMPEHCYKTSNRLMLADELLRALRTTVDVLAWWPVSRVLNTVSCLATSSLQPFGIAGWLEAIRPHAIHQPAVTSAASPMWPIHGQCECRTCGRRHPVCRALTGDVSARVFTRLMRRVRGQKLGPVSIRSESYITGCSQPYLCVLLKVLNHYFESPTNPLASLNR
jgi:hypothetical protein